MFNLVTRMFQQGERTFIFMEGDVFNYSVMLDGAAYIWRFDTKWRTIK